MRNVLKTFLLTAVFSVASQAATLFVYFNAPTYSPGLTSAGPFLGTGVNRTSGQSATATFTFGFATDDMGNPVNIANYFVDNVVNLSLSIGYSDDERMAATGAGDGATESWSGQIEQLDGTVLQSSGVGGISATLLAPGLSTQAVSFDPGSAIDSYLINTNFGGFVYRFTAGTGDLRFRGVSGDVIVTVEATPGIPEPATSALAGGALVVLALVGRHLRRS